jgi:hypothetical protein
MKRLKLPFGLPLWTALLALLPLAAATFSTSGVAAPAAQNTPRYIGAAKCKNCHSAEETGDQHGKWMKMKHAQAFANLASDEAKKAGAARGVAEPQKDAACLKCHTTGWGLPPESFKKGFEVADGVQCESCHGPGEDHMKARMAAAMGGGADEGFGDEAPAYVAIPAGEIVASPKEATCRECHNAESPTFERFCFYKFRDKAGHLNPKKPRSKEELAARLVCGCGDACACVTECEDGCGVAAGSLKGEK